MVVRGVTCDVVKLVEPNRFATTKMSSSRRPDDPPSQEDVRRYLWQEWRVMQARRDDLDGIAPRFEGWFGGVSYADGGREV